MTDHLPDGLPGAKAAAALLAPSGRLRIAINVSNGLLVTGRDAEDAPTGVAPDLGRALAASLGAEPVLVPFPNPGALADAAVDDRWDIGLIADEAQRAETIAFSPPYVEIEASYVVAATGALSAVRDVDQAGRRVAAPPRTAYGLWLQRNLHTATVEPVESLDAALDAVAAGQADAAAGLRQALLLRLAARTDLRLLPGRVMAVQQAAGLPKAKAAASPWLKAAIAAALETGLIPRLIAKHGVVGLTPAQGGPS